MGNGNGLRYGAALLALAGVCPSGAFAQKSDARKELDEYLSGIGASLADRRAQSVAAIHTQEEAERRKTEVRSKILALIGSLPERQGPVKFKEFGTAPGDGFRVEKVAYESLPGFFVTADVYVPSGAGPFPAVVVTPGHGPQGKVGEANWAANFARSGILTLAIDAFGQGERLQHYDPELEASKVCCSGEHEHANLSALLIGQHIARYFVNDGMRGVDYLIQRKDVDRNHLGAFGCSGGGTATAYLGALDPRISVTGVACYITSLKELMPTTGAQDAEQTIPGFLAEGLDLADWVELAAPRPYAIISTTADMFPFAGAKRSYEEARRIYGLYGAKDRLEWITGPGGHGNLGPISPQILSFMVRHLKSNAAEAHFAPYRPEHPDDLLVTPSGQATVSLGSETVESVTRQEARTLTVGDRPVSPEKVRAAVRSIAAVTAEAGGPPPVNLQGKEQKEGYRLETLIMRSEPGVEVTAIAAIPDKSGPKPAVLFLDETPKERVAGSPDVQRLAKSGHFVLIVQPRGTPSDPNAQNTILGPNTAIALQAMMVGKSLVGMGVDDAIRAVNWLVSLPDVDKTSITLYGRGAQGMVALHAAALDSRVGKVVVEGALISYRMALEAPLHRNLSDIVLPGVLRKYDTGDLMGAIAPRTVVLVNAVDAMGVAPRDEQVKKELATAFASGHVQLLRRGFRDPLPID